MPGGREISDPKCKVLVGGAKCGMRHVKWYHKGSTLSSTTGNLVTDMHTEVKDRNLPGSTKCTAWISGTWKDNPSRAL